MNTEHVLSIAKVIKEKAVKQASKDLAAGTYEVDFLVRILGSFTKGNDFEQQLVAKINYQLLAALALSKVNQNTRELIVNDFLMAMGRSDTSEEHQKLLEQVKDEIQPKLNELKEMTVSKMTGKLTTNLTAEVVGGGQVKKVA